MPIQGPYNIDWVYASASNAHVANNRDWFLDYTPFASRTDGADGFDMKVHGIGDVQLEVNMAQSSSIQAFHSLILRNVLHIPEAVTNIVAATEVEDFTQCSFAGNGEITNPATGVSLLLDRPHFYKLWLVGQPRGQTSLDARNGYWINVNWPAEERARWEAFKRQESGQTGVTSNAKQNRKRTISQSELHGHGPTSKDVGGGEGKKRNQKRRKGPVSTRNEVVATRYENVEPDTHERIANDGIGRISNSASQKLVRYSAEERAWLKRNYGSEFKFLRQHGLKIQKKGDRQQGESIVRATMAQELSECEEQRRPTDNLCPDCQSPTADDIGNPHRSRWWLPIN